MFIKYPKFIFFVVSFVSIHVNSQNYSGNFYSGYAGVYGIQENPASFVNNKPLWDVNIIGLGASIYSEYGYFSKESIRSLTSKNQTINASDSIPSNYNAAKDALFFADKHTGSFQAFNINTQIHLPSFCFKVKSFSFGLFANTRFYTGALDAPNFFDYSNLKIISDSVNYLVQPFNINAMVWSEIALHVGKSFELENENKVSFGINAKYLLGHEAGFFENNSDFKFQKHNDSIYSVSADTKVGFATGENFNTKQYNFGVLGTGIGADIGMEYMVVADNPNTKSLHKYKFGITIKDIGAITFDKNTQVHRYTFNNLSEISNNIHKNTTYADDILKRISTAIYGDSMKSLQSTTMTMYLPTSLRLNIDANIYKNFFLHASLSRRLMLFSPQIAAPNVISISPRFEQRWFEAGMNLSLAEDKWWGLGSYVRLGLLTVGSDHLLSYFIPENTLRGADIYFSFKIMPFGRRNKELQESNSGIDRFENRGRKTKDFGCWSYQ